MGAPDLSSWIWPDGDQQRAPQGLATVNPLILPQAARVFVNGRNANGLNPAVPLTLTPTGLGYTNTSNSALGIGLPGGNTLVTSNGVGTGDFSILCVTNAPPSSSVASIPYCTVTGATPEIYLMMNEPSSFSGVVSGDVSLGYWSAGGGLTLTGILDGKTHTILFTRVSGTLYGYVDGVLKGSASFTSAVYSSGITTTETLAGYSSANWGVTGYGVPLLVTANIGLSPAQAQSISANPWQIFQPPNLGIYMPASAAIGSATITGTFGALSSSISALQTASAAAAGGLALTTTAAANRSSAASGASAFGSLSASAAAGANSAAVTASSLGALSSALAATQSRAAVGATAFGALATSVTATGQAAGSAIISSTFGALASSGQAIQSRSATATASLVAASAVTATQQASASVASTLGPLSTSITVLDISADQAVVSGVLGALSSSCIVAQKASASALSALSLSTQVNASTSRQAAVSASIGALQCSATASESQAASANGVLGALATNVTVAPPYTATVSGSLGALSSSIFATLGAAVDPVVFMVLPETRGISVSAEARSYMVLPESREYVVST